MAAESGSVQRSILQMSVSAICREQGFSSASRLAIETLTEMLQSYLSELARSAKTHCELSTRVKPTLGDVRMALIDVGADLDSIPTYAKRRHRLNLGNPLKSRVTPNPKALEAGQKQPRPSYIPSHLPAFPDPHSYVKTPTVRQTSEEYKAVRERYASQRKEIEQGLAKFLAKTADLKAAVCPGLENDPAYLLIMDPPPPLPYLLAISGCEENEDFDLNNDDKSDNSKADKSVTVSDVMDNPFIRPAKKARKGKSS
ncbi:transcription initiation factor TFIID subunit 8-like [Actinia tenebrosa]|uniref:Transcription initiation factor TFIID subunit 8 n=1 Tax=Actinia tenebrosa TaxID=6105 RepID=A0A6P8H1D0_ACTTE|nr:transcription initiation factor TFIID subunit 8-like [Actinia tenebrosa]